MPTYIQSNLVNNTSSASTSQALAFSSNVTAGNILFCFSEWNLASGVASGNISSVTDTIGNTWTQITPTINGSNTTAGWGGPSCDLRWCLSKAAGPNTVTAVVSPGAFTYRRMIVAEYSGIGIVGGTPVDASHGASGNGTSFTTGNLTTLTANDALILFMASNAGSTIAAPAGYTARQTVTLGLYDNLSPQAIGTYSATGTVTTEDFVSYLVGTFLVAYQWLGVTDQNNDWMGSNDVYWGNNPSVQGAQSAANWCLYPGMTWMKNCFFLPRDVWQPSESTPYSGQTYPTPNTGGAVLGQTYPY